MRCRRVMTLVFGFLMVLIGCGKSASTPSEFKSFSSDAPAGAAAAMEDGSVPLAASTGSDQVAASEADPVTPTTRTERKIIYNATLDFVVEDFDKVPASIESMVREHDAWVAKSSLDTDPGRPRRGTWTVRVPVARYADFLRASGSLGELQRKGEDSREVTAEYFDLETRIRSKGVAEERLLKHLTDSTGKLDEILSVERELGRVRTEMEQMQGQMRILQDLTALSTVTITVQERRGYVPVESPSFGTEIARAWQGTIAALLATGRVFVLFMVVAAPWLVICGLPITLLLWLRKRRV